MAKRLSGFGLGYRPPHYNWISENRPKVDWFEIISENFMGGAPRPIKFLEKLRSDYPIATHGVSLSITSLDPVDKSYLKTLREFTSWLEPEIVSDHLCWTSLNGRNSHDLLPTPYTKLNLENVISKINQVQEVLKRPLVLENPSAYVAFANNEMTEAEFFTELVKNTDCGILLDINNAYVNWKNLGWNPEEYFFGLPRAAVKQFHLAGHSSQDGILIDTHDNPVPDGVWELYKKALKLWPQVPTLMEWDENIPEFETLMAELEKARNISRNLDTLEFTEPIKQSEERKNKGVIDLKTVYSDFIKNVGTPDLADIALKKTSEYLDNDLPVAGGAGFRVYNAAYFLRLHGVLKELFPTLAWIADEEGFSEIVTQYLETFPPHHYSITYAGQDFFTFLNTQELELNFGVPQKVLRDIATLEWARVEVFETPKDHPSLLPQALTSISVGAWETVKFSLTPALKIIDLEWDVGPAWASVNKDEDPKKPEQESCSYMVWRKNGNVQSHKILNEKADLLKSLRDGETFKDSISKASPQRAIELLLECVLDGVVTKII